MSEPITNLEDAVAALGALPMPVGPEPRTLDVVEEELTGANLSLWEEEQTTARLRLALESAQRGRRELRSRVAELELTVQQMCDALNGHDCPPPDETPFQLVTRVSIAWSEAERQVAELEAEKERAAAHTEHLASTLVARTEDLMAAEASADNVSPQVKKLRDLLAGQLTAVEDPHDSPLHHTYRIPRDLPERGGAK